MTHQFDEEIVQAIARDAGMVPDVVRAVHVREWQRLEQEARIKDYIPLLVMKHVREHFMHMAREEKPDTRDSACAFSTHDDVYRKERPAAAEKPPRAYTENKACGARKPNHPLRSDPAISR